MSWYLEVLKKYGVFTGRARRKVAIRRLHDTNRSGWWILITLFPIVGSLVFLVFMVLDSQPGDNEYGSNPKGVTV